MSEAEPHFEVPLPPMAGNIGIARRPSTIDWLKASDGGRLGYRFWQGAPDSAVVLYLHGIEGHSQWFENTATVLNERGLTIYAPDRRGSGMNEQSRGHVRHYRIWLEDLEIQIRYIRRQHRGCPLFLMANCWAAKLAAIVAQLDYKYSDHGPMPPFTGLILTSPAIYTHIDFPLLTKLQIAASWLKGKIISQFQNKDDQLKVWPIPLTTTMLTDNPEYLDYLQKDPMRLTNATSAFFVQTFFLTLKARQVAKNIKTPTFILQAGADQIVDIEQLENWYEKIAAPEKSMHVFPEVCHSLDFDRTWFKEYTHMLSDWIIARARRT